MVEWAVLAGLAPEERQRILSTGRRRRFAAGEVVFHEGDPADSFHLLAVGRVTVRVTTPQGDQAVLTVLGPGETFGELALLSADGLRTATVTASEPAETIAVYREDFRRLRAEHPSVDTVLLAALSQQVSRLSARLLEVLFVPARVRVMRGVVSLAGGPGDGVIRLSQEDLARMSGTTGATVNEVLRSAEKAGMLRLGRRRIEVLDPGRLRRSARR